MKQLERRRVIQLAAAFAVVPSLICQPVRAASGENTASNDPIQPPARSMTYKRMIQRQLGDGAMLSVERSFAVRFVKGADGFRIDGEQTLVEIDAPAGLEALLRLEKERVETGIFPIMLDQNGRIQSGATAPEAHQIDAALARVSQLVLESNRAPTERRELSDFVAAIHQAGSNLTTNLPIDLFAPTNGERSISREIALPDGLIGEVTTRFSASCDPQTHLMSHAKREIVTRMEGDARRTIESWSLLPANG